MTLVFYFILSQNIQFSFCSCNVYTPIKFYILSMFVRPKLELRIISKTSSECVKYTTYLLKLKLYVCFMDTQKKEKSFMLDITFIRIIYGFLHC